MNFLRQPVDDPEINLIPLVDVLLVILIFLMVTTTYSRFAELRINLPVAAADKVPERPREITLAINANGGYAIDGKGLDATTAEAVAVALRRARADRAGSGATGAGPADPVLVIQGDRQAGLQAVVTAMEAARLAGLQQITISTQTGAAQ